MRVSAVTSGGWLQQLLELLCSKCGLTHRPDPLTQKANLSISQKKRGKSDYFHLGLFFRFLSTILRKIHCCGNNLTHRPEPLIHFHKEQTHRNLFKSQKKMKSHSRVEKVWFISMISTHVWTNKLCKIVSLRFFSRLYCCLLSNRANQYFNSNQAFVIWI